MGGGLQPPESPQGEREGESCHWLEVLDVVYNIKHVYSPLGIVY